MRVFVLSVCMIFSCMVVSCKKDSKSKDTMNSEVYQHIVEHPIDRPEDLSLFFPRTSDEIRTYTGASMKLARQELDAILSIKPIERTFDNTARALDQSQSYFSRMASVMQLLSMTSPDKEIREASHQAAVMLNQFAVETYTSALLYKAFNDYLENQGQTERLNGQERYFLQETMKDFKREGLNLPEDQLNEVKKLKKEITHLSFDFEKNIASDKSSMLVEVKDLAGVDEHFVNNLTQEAGKYLLKCDYPTCEEVMNNCHVGETRKAFYLLFNNRACPQNVELLQEIIAKRDELAKKLSFESFAALNIDSEMARTPARVQSFLDDLLQKSSNKMTQEFDLLRNNIPDGIELDEQQRINPWDYSYIKSNYKKKHFNIDERVLAEYFPVQKALEGMFAIYQNFLGLEFKVVTPDWTWHDEVQLIQIYDKETHKLRGYLFLDLYPRDDKYSHACYLPLVAPQLRKNLLTGEIENIPSVGVVIANLPRASKERPALFKHHDVETFFHEFGHAMHGYLGRTELATFAGTAVKRDFVELPSQMFEEWMFDKEALRGVSSHYKTGESLPDDLLDKKIALKRFDSGYFVQRQCWLALLSLNYYLAGAQKDTDALTRFFHEKYFKDIRFEPQAHFQASFGHLMGYGACYYSYLWSKVFALDIFDAIKTHGLDESIGRKFVKTILSRGGSVDPNILLKDFLGREPQADAFMKDLGLL